MPKHRGDEHLGKYQYDLLEVGYSKKEAMTIAIKMATRKKKKKKRGKTHGETRKQQSSRTDW
jgi:hypothetical protein